jgi:hypothetical protein
MAAAVLGGEGAEKETEGTEQKFLTTETQRTQRFLKKFESRLWPPDPNQADSSSNSVFSVSLW